MLRIIILPLAIVAAITWAADSTDGMSPTTEMPARGPASRGLQSGTPSATTCDVWPAYTFILAPEPGEPSTPDNIHAAWRTLTARVGELGNEPSHEFIAARVSVVEPPNQDQIRVSLKNVDDPVRAERILEERGLVQVVDPGESQLQVGDDIRTPMVDGETTPTPLINSHDIERQEVYLVPDNDGRLVVIFRLNNAKATEAYAEFIAGNPGGPIPVVVDDLVIAMPTVTETFPDGIGVIAGEDDLDTSVLAIELKSGPLPIRLEVVGQESISPAELCFGSTRDGTAHLVPRQPSAGPRLG